MVYLLHDNYLFYDLWGTIDWISILYINIPKFLITLLTVGLLTFIFGILVYSLYNLVIKIFLKYKTIFLKD